VLYILATGFICVDLLIKSRYTPGPLIIVALGVPDVLPVEAFTKPLYRSC